eukprot:m.52552 g.52552  ORF g.52552 m.52552 type:complete len:251 (+) comp18290_c1_seq1:47-799(+)
MFRNQYDNDITIWSPQGRIHQVEYAMEATKQGAASVGLKNKDSAILVSLKKAPSALAAHQKKTFLIDSHVGVSIAGISSDARSLCSFMRTECMNSRWAFDEPLPISRLVGAVGSKMQRTTQQWGRRPFGVGLLVAGYDDHGPHIYQIDPSSNYYDCKGMSIGARSQSARTYVEKNLDEIATSDREGLIRHGLLALRECLPHETELDSDNCTVAIVSKDEEFTIYSGESVAPFLATIDESDDTAAMEETQS